MTTGSASEPGRVDIRPASAGDLEQWSPLFRAYREFCRLPPDEGVAERFPRPSTGANGLWLDDLYTSPAHRGGGIGRALIARVRAIAEAVGRSVVRWITAADNTTARGRTTRWPSARSGGTYDLVP